MRNRKPLQPTLQQTPARLAFRAKHPPIESDRPRIENLVTTLREASPATREFVNAYKEMMMNTPLYLHVSGSANEFYQDILGWAAGEGERILAQIQQGVVPDAPRQKATATSQNPAMVASSTQVVESESLVIPVQEEPGDARIDNSAGSAAPVTIEAIARPVKIRALRTRPQSAPGATKPQAEEATDKGAEESPTSGPSGQNVKTVAISAIKADPGFQGRAAINPEKVEEYRERMEAGDIFPPLHVFSFEEALWLTDGFHTHGALVKRGQNEAQVIIHAGTRREAVRYAIQANTTHGLPRTNEDKRHAARLALKEFPDWSDGLIAELAKVTAQFVGKLRKARDQTVSSCAKRLGRDGKRQSVKRKVRACAGSPPGQPKQTEEPLVERGEAFEAEDARVAPQAEETVTGTSQQESEFRSAEAWGRVEDHLLAELQMWPQGERKAFGEYLRRFADEACV